MELGTLGGQVGASSLREGESAPLIEFRAAGAQVRDTQAEVIRRSEALCTAQAGMRAAEAALDAALARLQAAEDVLRVTPPVRAADDPTLKAMQEIHDRKQAIDREIMGERLITAANGKVGEAHPGDYWAKAAPKRKRWSWKRPW